MFHIIMISSAKGSNCLKFGTSGTAVHLMSTSCTVNVKTPDLVCDQHLTSGQYKNGDHRFIALSIPQIRIGV